MEASIEDHLISMHERELVRMLRVTVRVCFCLTLPTPHHAAVIAQADAKPHCTSLQMAVYFLGGTYGTKAAATKATAALLRPVLHCMQRQPGRSRSQQEAHRLAKLLNDVELPKERACHIPLTRTAPLCLSNITCGVGRRPLTTCLLRLSGLGVSTCGPGFGYKCLSLHFNGDKNGSDDQSLTLEAAKEQLNMA